MSRLLLLLVAIELITMPVTQHLWAWDGFVHGGQDFELGLFMIVVCVCLGLLRAQHGRQRVSRLLAIRRRLADACCKGSRFGPAQSYDCAARVGRLCCHPPHQDSRIPLLI